MEQKIMWPSAESVMEEFDKQMGMDGNPEDLELRLHFLHRALDLIDDVLRDYSSSAIDPENVSALLAVLNEYVLNTRLAVCKMAR